MKAILLISAVCSPIFFVIFLPRLPNSIFVDYYAYLISFILIFWIARSSMMAVSTSLDSMLISAVGVVCCFFFQLSFMTGQNLSISNQLEILRIIFPILVYYGIGRFLDLQLLKFSPCKFKECFSIVFLFFLALPVIFHVVCIYSGDISNFWFNYYSFIGSNYENLSIYSSRNGLFLGNPNSLAFYSLPLLAAIIVLSGKWQIILAGILLSIVNIYFCSSRTSLFCLIFILLIYILSSLLNGKISCARKALIPISILVSLIFLAIAIYVDYVEATFNRYFIEWSSYGERRDLWESLLGSSLWTENILFGVGPMKEERSVYDSYYVLALYRYGVIGGSVIVISGLYMVISGIRNRSIETTTIVIFVGIKLIYDYSSSLFSDPKITFVYLFSFFIVQFSFSDERNQIPQETSIPKFKLN